MNRFATLFRVLAGYCVAALGGYMVVRTMQPLALVPFAVGVVLMFAGLIFAHPEQGIPMLGYMVSALRNLARLFPWFRKEEPRPHKHHRRSDHGAAVASDHEHRRRLSVSDYTINAPIEPPVPRDHRREGDD